MGGGKGIVPEWNTIYLNIREDKKAIRKVGFTSTGSNHNCFALLSHHP